MQSRDLSYKYKLHHLVTSIPSSSWGTAEQHLGNLQVKSKSQGHLPPPSEHPICFSSPCWALSYEG